MENKITQEINVFLGQVPKRHRQPGVFGRFFFFRLLLPVLSKNAISKMGQN